MRLDYVHLCTDCTLAAVNGDYDGMDGERAQEVIIGLSNLERDGFLASAYDIETGEGYLEFSWASCEGCNTRLGGARYAFSLVPLKGSSKGKVR